MEAKRKPDPLISRGSQSGSGSKQPDYITRNQPEYQGPSSPGDHSIITRRWIKTLLVRLACWDTLPAALTVLLSGGLRHD